MTKHLDITIDFETCGLTANAAPMQVALVPWMRGEDVDPFCNGQEAEPLVMYVDLRTCVVDGFYFDAQTLRWWASRSEAAKQAVTRGLAEPVQDVLVGIVNYIRSLRERYHLDSICLWSQGDLDTSILRYMAVKYDIDLDDIIPHTQLRDARTVILEALLIRARQFYREAIAKAAIKREQNGACSDSAEREQARPEVKAKYLHHDIPYPLPPVLEADVLRGDSKAYQMFDPLPDRYARGSEAHDALYDAMRTSWNTWQALKLLRQ